MTKKNYSEMLNNSQPMELVQKNTETPSAVSVAVPKLNVEITIEEFYESGEPIIRHAMLEELVANAKGEVKSEKLYISDNVAAFAVTISDSDTSVTCIGETNPRNLTDAKATLNPIFMAWKRAYDKAAMRYLGINLETVEEMTDNKNAETQQNMGGYGGYGNRPMRPAPVPQMMPPQNNGYPPQYAPQMIPPQQNTGYNNQPVPQQMASPQTIPSQQGMSMQNKVTNIISELPNFTEQPIPPAQKGTRKGRTTSKQSAPQQEVPQVVPQEVPPQQPAPQMIPPQQNNGGNNQPVPQQGVPQSYDNTVITIGKYANKNMTYGQLFQLNDIDHLIWCRNFAQMKNNAEQLNAAEEMLRRAGVA